MEKKDKPRLDISERGKRFKSASGKLLKVTGKFLFSLKVGKKLIQHPLYVVKNLSGDLILGFDLIQKHHLNYNTESKSFSWKTGGRWSRGQLKVCEKQTLAPLSVSSVQAVAERVPTKVTPLEGAKKKFILEKLNLDNVPVELRHFLCFGPLDAWSSV